MKNSCLQIIFLMGYTALMAQKPASIRTGRITADWQDRAKANGGGGKLHIRSGEYQFESQTRSGENIQPDKNLIKK